MQAVAAATSGSRRVTPPPSSNGNLANGHSSDSSNPATPTTSIPCVKVCPF